MFCRNCGNSVTPGQVFCGNCGYAIEQPNEEKTNEHEGKPKGQEFLKYTDRIKKINIMSLTASVIIIFAVLTLIFLPIFETPAENIDYVLNAYEDISDEEDEDNGYTDYSRDYLESAFGEDEALDEYEEKNVAFSYFRDVTVLFENLKMIFEHDKSSIITTTPLRSSLPFVVIVMFAFIGFIVVSGRDIYETVINLQNPKKGAMLKYDEILKSGGETAYADKVKKNSHFVWIYGVPVAVVLDTFFAKMTISQFDTLNPSSIFELQNLLYASCVRFMFAVNGIAQTVAVPIILFVAAAVVLSLKKREEKAIYMDIIEHKY